MTHLVRLSRVSALVLVLIPVAASSQSVTGRTQGAAMSREDFADAARRGLNLPAALEDGILGIRAMGGDFTAWCLEYRQVRVGGGCRGVAVYVDGIRVAEPGWFLAMQQVDDIERAEVLSGLEATTRYGPAAGNGALIIETRSGIAAASTANDRHITGLDWSALETEPYPWARVMASTFLANAAGVGVSLLLTDQCFGEDTRLDNPYRCSTPASVGTRVAGLWLPTVAGSLAARWAGATDRSRGRFVPALLFGTVTSAGGYLLFVDKRSSSGSDAGKVVGALLLTVATPLVTVLSDRIFRVLR